MNKQINMFLKIKSSILQYQYRKKQQTSLTANENSCQEQKTFLNFFSKKQLLLKYRRKYK